MISDVEQLVQQMKLSAATTEVEKIDARREYLQQLRIIEQKLEPLKNLPEVKGDNGIFPKIPLRGILMHIRMRISIFLLLSGTTAA